MKRVLFVLLCAVGLMAQDRYVTYNKSWNFCPRQDQRGSSPYQPTSRVTWETGTEYYPVGQRVDASTFKVFDKDNKPTVMSQLKGKPIVIGLWSTHCEPSLYLLSEMAQLWHKTAQFGFAVFPVNFDAERWQTIAPFLNQQRVRTIMADVKVFTPDKGPDGVYLLMKVVPVLPTFFVLDREGRVAARSFGFKPGELARCLQRVYDEPLHPLPAPAPVPEKKEKGMTKSESTTGS